jgi:hypothetical protein
LEKVNQEIAEPPASNRYGLTGIQEGLIVWYFKKCRKRKVMASPPVLEIFSDYI